MKSWRINWRALIVIAIVVGGLALISTAAALAVFALVLLMLVVDRAGASDMVTGSVGDDTLSARDPERRERQRPYL